MSQTRTPTLHEPSAVFQPALKALLFEVGENPDREGLERTPARFEKAFRELTAGYRITPAQAVGEGLFKAEGAGPVAVRDIEFFSLCEHHLLPFWGHVSITYLPQEHILGLSKLARLVETFARRLQVQERLNREIALAVSELVGARAVAVQIRARHMCMMMRGVRKIDSETLTEFAVGMEDLTAEERERMWSRVKT